MRHIAVNKTLIHTLVAAAQQNGALAVRPGLHRRVVQGLTNGGKQNNGRALTSVGANGLQALFQRLGQHHHAGATAKGAVVHAAVIALGNIARVPQTHIHLTRLKGTARHACF